MTPLERAARAASDVILRTIPGDIDITPREASAIARAVIEAIREPSQAMHVAAVAEADRIRHPLSTQQAWRAMIDALLEEGN